MPRKKTVSLQRIPNPDRKYQSVMVQRLINKSMLDGKKLVAERAKEKNIVDVVFDRGGNIYHGRVKELAEGAREGGLNF